MDVNEYILKEITNNQNKNEIYIDIRDYNINDLNKIKIPPHYNLINEIKETQSGNGYYTIIVLKK